MTTLRERWNRFKTSPSGITLFDYWKHLKETRLFKTLKDYIWWDDVIALLLLALGILYYWANIPENPSPKWQQIYQDMYSDMIGIGITVLILGNVDQYLRIKSEKKRLILQMGSPNQEFAIEAVRQRRQNGWLVDGTTKGAYLGEAHLKKANLNYAHLEGANLHDAHLEEANLNNAHLERANLYGAHLEGAKLNYANLKGAYLGIAHMEGAKLINTNLKGAKLNYANLKGANLYGAHLEGAKPIAAILDGVDLTSISYDKITNWHFARYTKGVNGTKWPEGFDPEIAGYLLPDEYEKLKTLNRFMD